MGVHRFAYAVNEGFRLIGIDSYVILDIVVTRVGGTKKQRETDLEIIVNESESKLYTLRVREKSLVLREGAKLQVSGGQAPSKKVCLGCKYSEDMYRIELRDYE
jgi:hypothetical protein